MICPDCGTRFPEGQEKCHFCGYIVGKKSTDTPLPKKIQKCSENEIKDFIIEHKDTIFVYSVLVALESALMIFKINSPVDDSGVFQAALLCGIFLMFLLWIKFVWSTLNYLSIKSYNSIIEVFLVAQNAIFAVLLAFPIIALGSAIYKIDITNFSMSVFVIVWAVLLYGSIPFIKYLPSRINRKRDRHIVLLILIIFLAIISDILKDLIFSPIIVSDISQLQTAVNFHIIFSVLLSALLAIVIVSIISVFQEKPKFD